MSMRETREGVLEETKRLKDMEESLKLRKQVMEFVNRYDKSERNREQSLLGGRMVMRGMRDGMLETWRA